MTIAVHRASECQQGFLGPQQFGQETHQCVFWADGGGGSGVVQGDDKIEGEQQKMTRPPKEMLLRAQHKKIHSLPIAPLDTRAWTPQEVVLPRRLLHVFEHEMA